MITNADNYCFVKTIMRYHLYKNDVCISYCHFCNFVNENDSKSIYISFLHVDPDHRGKGYGTRLLYEVLMDYYVNHDIRYAYLADTTDRCRQSNNIYTKMGFTYVQIADDNDMVGNLRHILFGKTRSDTLLATISLFSI